MGLDITVRKNERSWAIEIISQINKICDSYDLIIKRAGGESTVSNNGKKVMFPDVILYQDKELNRILQGWELKMPDVPITDVEFIKDAHRKARALGLRSCVIWNFTYVRFYVLDEKTDNFEIVRQWENLDIVSRADVATYKSEWEHTLQEVILTVSDYLETNRIRYVSVGDMISDNAVNILINENKDYVSKYLQKKSITDSVLDANISVWWNEVNSEYQFDESNRFNAYSKTILLNWACRIIFAHLIKRQHRHAYKVDDLTYDTTPAQANIIFKEITKHCDFYNVFKGTQYNEMIPDTVWDSIIELSLFLRENGIRNIDQSMLQNILEKCVNTTRRELNGQYTTPVVLARILSRITIHNYEADCADICCGTGTIAHEILSQKKQRIRIEDAVKTTWASDKYSLPLQIANISLTSVDSINLANRIFKHNALDLLPGETIRIVDPQNGQGMTYAIPLFDSVCSNLPFVAFENIPEDDKDLISPEIKRDLSASKFDLSYHIVLQIADMIQDNGYLGVIMSNSWLGTKAGRVFYDKIQDKYNIRQVHISGAGRWFQNADVVTTILLLQKKSMEERGGEKYDANITFWLWKKSLEEIEVFHQDEDIIVNSSLVGKSVDESVIHCSKYTKEQIDRIRSYNISYNALFHDMSWMLDIGKKLSPVRKYFEVFRGSRRGWDALFFPKGQHGIEDKFLYPALFNAKGVNNLIVSPDRVAFSCGLEENELEERYPGSYNWIKQFKRQHNKKKIPLPIVLKKSNMKWYEMKPNEVANLFTMMNPDKRMFFGKFEEPTFINQRLIGLKPQNPGVDIDLCHALMNTIIMKFMIEAVGFGRGLGVLDINKDNIASCYMLDPSLLACEQIDEIKAEFEKIKKLPILSVEDELNDETWINYNIKVLKAYGIEGYYERISESLKSLLDTRRAVKHKYDIQQFRNMAESRYGFYKNGNQIAADE